MEKSQEKLFLDVLKNCSSKSNKFERNDCVLALFLLSKQKG